jgi:hypothetical protein
MERGSWFDGVDCPASVEHATKIRATQGKLLPEPDDETKERLAKKHPNAVIRHHRV